MAGATLLTLLDDITAMLDDVAGMTKVAAGKTAGVVGDDLALNAQQVMGTPAERELPVVWAVAKGSLVNKLVLVPSALLLSVFLPILVTPLLMLGGLYLCYEGAEKILHRHAPARPHSGDVVREKDKIRGAIRTDFILSAEIIIIVLGVVAQEPLDVRILTLSAVALGMTVLVYGLVAAIVKMDDFGLYLTTRTGALRAIGTGILKTAPVFMRTLGIVGTIAMFLVGGQILLHGVPPLHHMAGDGFTGLLASGAFGLFCGAAAVGVMAAGRRIRAFFR